jgi:hypothetical protein
MCHTSDYAMIPPTLDFQADFDRTVGPVLQRLGFHKTEAIFRDLAHQATYSAANATLVFSYDIRDNVFYPHLFVTNQSVENHGKNETARSISLLEAVSQTQPEFRVQDYKPTETSYESALQLWADALAELLPDLLGR